MTAPSDTVIAYEIRANHDLETCLLCAVLDRKRYETAAAASAVHENCRCKAVPAAAPAVPDISIRSAAPGAADFETYFQKLSFTDQKNYLGSVRFRMWKKYKLRLADFVDLGALREYTEEELLKKYPLTAPVLSENCDFSAKLSYVPRINLAQQQNGIPVAYELKLANNSGRELNDLECRISAAPDFILAKSFFVDKIKAGEELLLDDLKLDLNYDLLSTLSENVKGNLKLEISAGGDTIFRQDHEYEAFAPDQWLGLEFMPELLASFVTPNMEVVAHLHGAAVQELERVTGTAVFQGYEADKKRIYEICAAIYRAIHNWGLRYALPAASFGTPGQRIRFADAIYQHKLGTCLDTTLLFASVMEACGLHPVLMLQKGHAYIGCHLIDRYFPDIPMDDLQLVRKLTDMDEFLVCETTMVTTQATFAKAEAAARHKHLNIDSDFVCAIDVHRARLSQILPLPLKRSVNGMELEPIVRNEVEQEAGCPRKLEESVDLSQLSNNSSQPQRVVRWTKKLLDLSLRNRLLNVKNNKLTIPIVCSDITLLEDKIAANASLTLSPMQTLLSEKDIHDLSMLRNSDIKTQNGELLENELAQHRLRTPLAQGEMSRRLTAMYRQSRTDLEEGGVNTLYLAIGFVEWKVTEKDQKTYLAPILLLPVRLQRRSIIDGFKITRFDGDTIINETLLELLRTEYHLSIPGLSPLPMDDAGVNVPLVMQIFRQAIKDMKGWEVRETACLGLFSFGKFVMWTDMTARLEILQQHPLISHLITANGLYDDGIEVFPPEEISKHLDFSKLYCPVSADSSQLAAVLYSEMGKSFVLHGPPGTGKSQTITNIIAHNLALGKRVLFVSEKKAALDVVHKRLSQIGLKPFCLELHSNKSGKSEVLAQFNESLQTAAASVPEEWEETIASLTTLRKELDDYVNELHHQYPNGFSAYDCFACLAVRKEMPKLTIAGDLLLQTKEAHADFRQKFIDLAGARRNVTPEALQGLQLLDPVQWSPFLENGLLEAAQKLQNLLADLSEKFSAAAGHLALRGVHSLTAIYQTARLMAELKESEDIPGAFFCDEFPDKAEYILGYADNARKLAALKEKLHAFRLECFKEYDFSGIAERIARNERSFIVVRFLRNNAMLKELKGLKKSGGAKLSLDELQQLIPDVQEYLERQKKYDEGINQAAQLLGKQWKNTETSWDTLQPKLDQAQNILDLLSPIVSSAPGSQQALTAKLQELMPDISSRCRRGSEMRDDINALLESWNLFQEQLQFFEQYASALLKIDDTELFRKVVGDIISNIASLRNVMRYRLLYAEVLKHGGKELAEIVEDDTKGCDLAELFDRTYFKNMLDQLLSRSPLLCRFSGESQNERVKKFGEFDELYMALTQKLIFAKLASRLPRRRTGPCPEGSDLGMLKRECEKRARQKPVRVLLEQLPKLAPILKPCFLMSPLSVAQYLPADSSAFDLIIFDEASQIPVWDAIGVIARAKQLIVVGDPKQMPPTNFFQKGESEDEELAAEDIEDVEDMENILDECLASGVYSAHLNWHYRSRHESLIAFSNHHYYADRLFTFPAAKNSEKLGIRFEFVPDGIYDRKNTRTNRKEAEALVKYIFKRLESANGNYRSIGVVTFSQAQKDLIEDLLEKERVHHPALESYFSDTAEEPLFVKNLENVQGDERDVILFSIGYAPDVHGKFSMNFGPLNRQGGERRLNVAITRAKEQVVVFSSIRSEQIELSRTSAVGAAHLKYFLDYAEKGAVFYSGTNQESRTDGLCEAIAGFLTEKGYTVERSVGCSGFRIDLAVRHPERPEEFLLGIECDNASYASQKTTRDRDNLRHQVLKGLGWHTCRAWCIDWTLDRERAENDLLEFIEKIKNEEPEEPPCPAEQEPLPEPEEPVPAPAEPVPTNRQEYHIWKPETAHDQTLFHQTFGRRIIRKQIADIIVQESPICESLLKRRIIKAWGISRVSINVQKTLAACISSKMRSTQHGEEKVFWSPEQLPEKYSFYRVGRDEESKRAIDEIPPEEIANAMHELLLDFNSCEKETLFRETAKLFGFSAVTAKVRKFLEYGYALLGASGRM